MKIPPHGEEILTMELLEDLYPYDAETNVIGGPRRESFFFYVIDRSHVEYFVPDGVAFSVVALQEWRNFRWRKDAILVANDPYRH